MEINVKKQNKHVIAIVQDGSIAQELELVPGDILLTVNGQPVEDIFDYRYLMNEEFVVLEVEKANGEIWELEVEKEYEEDLGITFEKDLMDDYRSCSNHCIFCSVSYTHLEVESGSFWSSFIRKKRLTRRNFCAQKR